MAIDFTIKRGDRLPNLRATLTDAIGNLPNLTGATVTFIMKDKLTGEATVSAAATTISATNAIVEYQWADGDTDIASVYNGEFEVVYADGKPETFPNSRHIGIKVFTDLGGLQ